MYIPSSIDSGPVHTLHLLLAMYLASIVFNGMTIFSKIIHLSLQPCDRNLRVLCRKYLEMDCALPEDKVHKLADHVSEHLSCNLRELRRLFLVEDLVDSIKVNLGL